MTACNERATATGSASTAPRKRPSRSAGSMANESRSACSSKDCSSTRPISPRSRIIPMMRSISARVSGPLISSSRSAEPRSNSSSAAEKRGSGWPVNAGENQEPASSPVQDGRLQGRQRARAVGRAVDGVVVDHVRDAVGARGDVDLDPVRPGAGARGHRRQRVLGRDRRIAAVGDHRGHIAKQRFRLELGHAHIVEGDDGAVDQQPEAARSRARQDPALHHQRAVEEVARLGALDVDPHPHVTPDPRGRGRGGGRGHVPGVVRRALGELQPVGRGRVRAQRRLPPRRRATGRHVERQGGPARCRR